VNREARRRQRKAGGTGGVGSEYPTLLQPGGAVRAGHSTATNPQSILWYSNAPWAATGYGEQTAQILPRLVASGHKLAVLANYGLEGAATDWNGIHVYPRGMAPYSDDVLQAHAAHWADQNPTMPHCVITLFDAWVLEAKALAKIDRIYSWVPIDHKPAPPKVVAWCKQPNVKPIAMSKFGQEMLEIEGVESFYAPHGIEAAYKPTEKIVALNGESMTGRQMARINNDAFVVMMNSANKGAVPSRKAFGENLLAFSLFAQDKPDAVLYMHTEIAGSMGGIDLPKLAAACGIRDGQIVFVDQYAYRASLPKEVLAAFYTQADVLLACSMGEGFGIPVVEAQACGTRVIVSNFTAQPELCGDGWIVTGQPWWDPMQHAWFFTPSVTEIVAALEAAYVAPRGASQKAIDFAAQYEANRVYEDYWVPIMEQIGAES